MDDSGLAQALDRADRALSRIERALHTRQSNGRDEELRHKVREAVAELDQLIRSAGQ
jgi:Zn-dependent oligopeptidase